jgi:hypothetical protein
MYFLCCSMYFCVLCIVCFVTFRVLFVCICVLNECHRVATQLQLNISYRISYHIIAYHIISYIISYHILLVFMLNHLLCTDPWISNIFILKEHFNITLSYRYISTSPEGSRVSSFIYEMLWALLEFHDAGCTEHHWLPSGFDNTNIILGEEYKVRISPLLDFLVIPPLGDKPNTIKVQNNSWCSCGYSQSVVRLAFMFRLRWHQLL